jgi:hypothetical protein
MKMLSRLSKVMAIAAIFWAVAVTVYLLAFATATSESVVASGIPDQSPVTTRTVKEIPFISYAGPTAIAAVIAFSSLLISGAVLAWKATLLPAEVISILALVATYVTGFTIGGLYFPGAAALCISTVLAFVVTRTDWNREAMS